MKNFLSKVTMVALLANIFMHVSPESGNIQLQVGQRSYSDDDKQRLCAQACGAKKVATCGPTWFSNLSYSCLDSITLPCGPGTIPLESERTYSFDEQKTLAQQHALQIKSAYHRESFLVTASCIVVVKYVEKRGYFL